MKINNVTLGDVFKIGKHNKGIVVDFIEKRSLRTKNITGYICIAISVGLAKNEFEIPFSTVVRNRIS